MAFIVNNRTSESRTGEIYSYNKDLYYVYNGLLWFLGSFIGGAELSVMREDGVLAEGRHTLALTGTPDTTYGSLTVEVMLRFYQPTIY